MGSVFRATHELSGKEVAIKWLLRPAADPRARSRFLREARAAAKVDHPNVVNVYDVDQAGAYGYLVMELLHGETLRSRLKRQLPTATELIALLLPAMRGIVAVHAAGVIHRDLKPENIFLCVGPDGSPREAKVLDFGISALTEPESGDTRLSSDGVAIGTPGYMSPEQLLTPLDVDERSDIYALGIILYEALTGRLPLQAANARALLMAARTHTPPPLAQLRSDLPASLSDAVMRAIATRREDRFANVQSLIDALQAPQADLSTPPGVRRAKLLRVGAVVTLSVAAAAFLLSTRAAPHQHDASAVRSGTPRDGGGLRRAEPYLSGAACASCLAGLCSEQSAACAADNLCSAFLAQARAATKPLIADREYLAALADGKWQSERTTQHGAWFAARSGLTQCARTHCSLECGIGRKLDCVGQFDYPSSYPSSAAVKMRLSSIRDARPLPSWRARACAPGPNCEHVMGTASSDEQGFVVLPIDFSRTRPNTQRLPEFDGTIELEGPPEYSPRVLQQSAPLLDGSFTRWVLSSREQIRAIHEPRQLPMASESRGSLDIQTQDCEGWIAWGLTLEIWNYTPDGYVRCPDCRVMYPDDAGNPEPLLKGFVSSKTRASAVVVLPPGDFMVVARDIETGARTSVLPHVTIRAGHEHALTLYPASRQQLSLEF
jgi:hypothetical protein